MMLVIAKGGEETLVSLKAGSETPGKRRHVGVCRQLLQADFAVRSTAASPVATIPVCLIPVEDVAGRERAMDLGLTGKAVAVTGGTRGIGYAIAEACAREGASVAICGRSAESLSQAERSLKAHGGKVFATACDVAEPAAVAAFVNGAAEHLGGLRALVNNPSGFGEEDDEEGWARGIEVDLMGLVRATWAAIPHFKAAGCGALLHISSISGIGASSLLPYGAVKAAVIQLTQSQARKYAADRIRVNCIAPGSIEFPGGLWAQCKTDDPDLYKEVLEEIPFGRMGKPEEVAQVAVFLLSEAASWVTGQTVAVDGAQNL